jgi:ribosome maturation factor RimP
MADAVTRVRELAAPLLTDLGLTLYDLELGGGLLRITVDRPGGVDLDALAVATRVISRQLDHDDPIEGHYTLEVTSPGLERRLRTPEHFESAVGATVAIRTLPGVEPRRVQGTLAAVEGDVLVVDVDGEGEQRLSMHDVERARTVFEWGPAPKPGTPARKRASA